MKRLLAIPGAMLLLLATDSAMYAQEAEPRAPGSEAQAQDAEPESQVFYTPMYRGYRLDWCLVWGDHCGQDAAHVFCLSQGYWTAESYGAAWDIGLTMLIGTNELCQADYCDGFSYIVCQ